MFSQFFKKVLGKALAGKLSTLLALQNKPSIHYCDDWCWKILAKWNFPDNFLGRKSFIISFGHIQGTVFRKLLCWCIDIRCLIRIFWWFHENIQMFYKYWSIKILGVLPKIYFSLTDMPKKISNANSSVPSIFQYKLLFMLAIVHFICVDIYVAFSTF